MICIEDYNIRAVDMILRLNISFKYMFLKVGPNKLCAEKTGHNGDRPQLFLRQRRSQRVEQNNMTGGKNHENYLHCERSRHRKKVVRN